MIGKKMSMRLFVNDSKINVSEYTNEGSGMLKRACENMSQDNKWEFKYVNV